MKNTFSTVAVVVLAAALGAAALGYTGNGALFDPLEARLLFSPRPVDREWLRSLFAGGRAVEAVSIVTPDGVTLRGWLRRPAGSYGAPGKRFPLVIVYGGVRR